MWLGGEGAVPSQTAPLGGGQVNFVTQEGQGGALVW